jgi:two-component system heavy metal sensor histidine kinase CusS
MSSKTGSEVPSRPPRTWSLGARLTAWYAASSFLLVLFVALSLRSSLEAGLDQEDDGLLADEADLLSALLRERPGNFEAVRLEVEVTTRHRRREEVSARLFDGSGAVVAETPGLDASLPPEAFPRPDPRTPYFGDRIGNDGAPYRVYAAQLPAAESGSFLLQIAHGTSDDLRALAAFRNRMLLVLGVALIACAVIGYAVARGGMRRIESIAEAAGRVRPSQLEERISTAGLPSELEGLASAMNGMLDRLEASFERLSQFSADLAHEIRTPVGRMRGEAEVALGRARTPEEYRECLASMVEECVRLSELVDRLLFLARTEDPASQVAGVSVNLGRELAAVQEFWSPSAEEAGVTLVLEKPGEILMHADPALLRRAVGNLVANSLAHTPRGGRITISLRADEREIGLQVRDTGSGIPAAQLPRVFDRFFRGDDARSPSSGGAGLGLSIARAIAVLHGGRVDIESRVGRGTSVEIVLPRKMTTS